MKMADIYGKGVSFLFMTLMVISAITQEEKEPINDQVNWKNKKQSLREHQQKALHRKRALGKPSWTKLYHDGAYSTEEALRKKKCIERTIGMFYYNSLQKDGNEEKYCTFSVLYKKRLFNPT